MSFRVKGKKFPREYPNALPVTSVEDLKEAEDLRIFTCKLAYGLRGRFLISPDSGFVRGDINTLDAASEYLEKCLRYMKERSHAGQERNSNAQV